MPRQRKAATRILTPPGEAYAHGYQAAINWSEHEGGFVWNVLSYIVQPGIAPVVPLAEGLARTYQEAAMAMYLALAELDILQFVGGADGHAA